MQEEGKTRKKVPKEKRQTRRKLFFQLIVSLYRTFYFPSLEVLCYNLEAANSHPSYALDHLKDLAYDVDKISEHLEMIDEYFAKGKDEVEIVCIYFENSHLIRTI